MLAVSAGFDAFKHDPFSIFHVDLTSFAAVGQRLAGVGVPVFSVLEGGYSDRLGECVKAYVEGLEE